MLRMELPRSRITMNSAMPLSISHKCHYLKMYAGPSALNLQRPNMATPPSTVCVLSARVLA